MKEKEDGLVLFHEMQMIGDTERENFLDDFESPLGLTPDDSPVFKIMSTYNNGADDFLSKDGDKNDYDWLLTPPGTPLFPSLDKEPQKPAEIQTDTPKNRPTVLKSRLANSLREPESKQNTASKPKKLSPGLTSNSFGIRRSVSAGCHSSKSKTTTMATLTGRTPLTSTISTSTKTSGSPTHTPRMALTSSKISHSVKSSTTIPQTSSYSKSSSLHATQPTSSSLTDSLPIPHGHAISPISKTNSLTPRNEVTSSFSMNGPKKTPPTRPVSASRARQAPLNARSSSVDPGPKVKPRRQSCSPSRGSTPIGIHSSRTLRELCRIDSDNISPVVLGTKMVERVVNSRRLVPPKQDKDKSFKTNLSGKTTPSLESSGFGRTLSKTSLDMALRHMDIRRRIPGTLRPIMTTIPVSSTYSVKFLRAENSSVSVSDSPIATSSNDSSEQSIQNNNGNHHLCFHVSEIDEVASGTSEMSPSINMGR